MKIILALLSVFTFSSFANNLDNVVENSVQIPITGNPNTTNWFLWSKNDLDKFNYINTFVIHPVASDYQNVTYEGCVDNRSSGEALSCPLHTETYIARLGLQIKQIQASNSSHRIYIGVPHAAESGKRPTADEIRAFLAKLTTLFASTGIYLDQLTGVYLTDEAYNGGTAGVSTNIVNSEVDFQYFVNLRLVMNEYAHFNTMPVMWMPHYRRQKEYEKISNLLTWQNNNMTIFNRIVIQPGYYKRNAGAYYNTAISDVKYWVQQNCVAGVCAGSETRIGAMVEVSPAVDWCTNYVQNGTSLLAHGNLTYRPQYTAQHSQFMDLTDTKDTNFFISQRTSEYDNHTLEWEKNNGATATRGNPYLFIDKFYEKVSLGYQSMNQSSFCTMGVF